MPFQPERSLNQMQRVTDINGRGIKLDLTRERLVPNRIPNRDGTKTDEAAFKEYGESAGNVFRLIKFLRPSFTEDKLALIQLSLFSAALVALPEYLALRKDNPVPENKIPPSVIDASRLAIGISLATNEMINEGRPYLEQFSPQEIYNFADGENATKTNYFISEEILDNEEEPRSCPAPRAAVERVLDAMINAESTARIAATASDWTDHISPSETMDILSFGLSYVFLKRSVAVLANQSEHTEEEIENAMNMYDQFYGPVNESLGYKD